MLIRAPVFDAYNRALVLDAPCGELDTNGRSRVGVELVSREAAQQIGLTDSAVTGDDDFEEVVIAAISIICEKA